MTISLPLSTHPDVCFLIDDEDENRVSGHRWRLGHGYVVTSIRQDGAERQIFLHQLIMGMKPDRQVDQINHDKLDNRSQNLRWVTPQQNTRNRRLFRSSRTGFIGVWQQGERFRACLTTNRRLKHMTIYNTAETAALVRDAYARYIDEEHFVLNFPDRPVSPEIYARLQAILYPLPPAPKPATL